MVNIPSISNKRKKTKNNPKLNILPELEFFLRPLMFHSPLVYALFPGLLFFVGILFRRLHIEIDLEYHLQYHLPMPRFIGADSADEVAALQGLESAGDGGAREKALGSELLVGIGWETTDGIEHQSLGHRQVYSII